MGEHQLLANLRDDLIVARGQGKTQPRVHGNGFVQLDLSEQTRLHVWGHRDIPQQRVNTAIHDHRFDFMSTVLRGRMISISYCIARYEGVSQEYKQATHRVLTPQLREGEDTVLVPHTGLKEAVLLAANGVTVVGENCFMNSYTVRVGEIHETVIDRPTVTLMKKIKSYPEYAPRVFVPTGCEPDNEHNRHSFDPARLWDIIFDVMGG